ncbi:MAG: UDP-N-acetylmuramoyl-L-alanine--D-glutamate ligase [Clostridia bacterium]|nr:UDP-N-acetylmuramoyl-L-alanine--D-glutamate ligase [Clostridia bacterium]MDD4386185.1 UDP-N-acetylmuramoyl-L-alanine--D-glutamate ligase [Clostridia bacterium]
MVEKTINDIYNFLDGKKILILGYSREGKSTYNFIRNRFKNIKISILDYNIIDKIDDENVEVYCDNEYEEYFKRFDLVIKSPGVSIKRELYDKYKEKIVSQTSIFLEYSKNIVIGITGTKGKSTTSSLIHHIFKSCNLDSKLVGNIGTPILSEINDIKDSTVIVFEMSSHQLQYITKSPKIAVLLNIYEEHLDYYESFNEYIVSKENIYKFQNENDILIYNSSSKNINIDNILKVGQRRLPVYINNDNIKEDYYINIKGNEIIFCIDEKKSIINIKDIKTNLTGEHNLYNIVIALAVSNEIGLEIKDILDSISSFKGLEHRMEYVGKYNGINFYNDSIATIPEATICAIKSLGKVDTIIIGGKDRGVNYSELVKFLVNSKINKILLIAESGRRIYDLLDENNNRYIYAENLENATQLSKLNTPKNGTCLLSPASASYGYYKNFEERGKLFKELVKK